MEKFDKIFGVALLIMSILSCVANYFNVLATPAIVVNLVLVGLIVIVAVMGTYNYQPYHNHNPGKFWLIFCTVNGVILVGAFYALGCGLISQKCSLSIMVGPALSLIPYAGVLLGDCGRILFKHENSVI